MIDKSKREELIKKFGAPPFYDDELPYVEAEDNNSDNHDDSVRDETPPNQN